MTVIADGYEMTSFDDLVETTAVLTSSRLTAPLTTRLVWTLYQNWLRRMLNETVLKR